MRWVSIWLFCFAITTAFAQNSTIEGTVYSGSYLKPLQKVKVRIGHHSTRTDYDGHFSIPIEEGEPMSFYHSEYATYTMPFNRILLDQPNEIYLIPTSNLYSMVLEGNQVEKVQSADYENIVDYTFLEDTLVVLSYLNLASSKYTSPDKSFENCAMTLLHRGAIIERKIVPDKVFKLQKDPFNRLFLELRDTCYEVVRTRSEIAIRGFSFSEYFNQILPIEGVSTDGIFYIKYYSYLPVRLLRYFDPKTEESYTLYTARNLKYFAKVNDDFEMLSPPEIEVAKELASHSDINYSFYSTYVRSFNIERDISKPKVQGFMVDSSFYFFDFKNDIMLIFDADGTLRKSNNTIYLDELSRERFMYVIEDPYTQTLYTLHNKSGVEYIRKINPTTGSAGRPFKIHHPFAKDVKVFEGYVYYIHESPVSETQSEILREKLPF